MLNKDFYKNIDPKELEKRTQEINEQVNKARARDWMRDNPFMGKDQSDPSFYEETDAEVILDEAARNSIQESGYYIDRTGERKSVDDLDENVKQWFYDSSSDDSDKAVRKTKGLSALGSFIDKTRLISPLGNILFGDKDNTAQEAHATFEKRFGWMGFLENAEKGLFKMNGFVPVLDPETNKMVLKETALDSESLGKVRGEVMSAYGSPLRERNFIAPFFEDLATTVANTPGMAVGALSTAENLFEGLYNKAFTDKGFTADNTSFLNQLNEQIGENENIMKMPENHFTKNEAWYESAESISGGLGELMGSILQFGGVGRGVSLGSKLTGASSLVGGLAKKRAAQVLGKNGATYTKAQLNRKTQELSSKWMNNLISMNSGMLVNTGYVQREFGENLDPADAAALASAVGFISSIIETGVGNNTLNKWLIGTEGKASKEIIDAISEETGGRLNAEAIADAMKNKGFMDRMGEYFTEKAAKYVPKPFKNVGTTLSKTLNPIKKGVSKSSPYKKYVDFKGSKKGKVISKRAEILGKALPKGDRGSAMRMGHEEGTEEFLQSMAENVSKLAYNELFAEEGTLAGDGRFEYQSFRAEDIISGMSDYALGFLGGSLGGAFRREEKETTDIANLVAQGYSEDLRAVMDSLKDQGRYTDEQHKIYRKQVDDLEALWEEHADEILEANRKASKESDGFENLDVHNYTKNKIRAFNRIVTAQKTQKLIDELQYELETNDELTDEERQMFKDQVRSLKQEKYALDESIKSLKDYRKANYSQDVRDYEDGVFQTKAYLMDKRQDVRDEITELENTIKEAENGSKEHKEATEKLKERKEYRNRLSSSIKSHNDLLQNLTLKSYRQRFDKELEFRRKKERNSFYQLADGKRFENFRALTSKEDPEHMRGLGYAVLKAGDRYYTDSQREIPRPKPKPKPKKTQEELRQEVLEKRMSHLEKATKGKAIASALKNVEMVINEGAELSDDQKKLIEAKKAELKKLGTKDDGKDDGEGDGEGNQDPDVTSQIAELKAKQEEEIANINSDKGIPAAAKASIIRKIKIKYAKLAKEIKQEKKKPTGKKPTKPDPKPDPKGFKISVPKLVEIFNVGYVSPSRINRILGLELMDETAIDYLESKGIISEADGPNARKFLMSKEEAVKALDSEGKSDPKPKKNSKADERADIERRRQEALDKIENAVNDKRFAQSESHKKHWQKKLFENKLKQLKEALKKPIKNGQDIYNLTQLLNAVRSALNTGIVSGGKADDLQMELEETFNLIADDLLKIIPSKIINDYISLMNNKMNVRGLSVEKDLLVYPDGTTSLDGKNQEYFLTKDNLDTKINAKYDAELAAIEENPAQEVLYTVRKKGEAGHRTVIKEEVKKGVTELTLEATDEHPEEVIKLTSEWVRYSKGDESRPFETLTSNEFSSLYEPSFMTEEQKLAKDLALREKDFENRLVIEVTNQYKNQYQEEQDKSGVRFYGNKSKTGVIGNDATYNDLSVYYVGEDGVKVLIGNLNNPGKYRYKNKDGKVTKESKPIRFSEISFEEFSKDFEIVGDHSPAAYQKLIEDQESLIKLREGVDRWFENQAEDGKDATFQIDDRMIRFKFSTRYVPLEPNESTYDLKDTDAKDKDGDFVIFDTVAGRYITKKTAKVKSQNLPKMGNGSRYKAFVQIGSVSRWIDVVPKATISSGKVQKEIDAINEAREKVFELGQTSPDSKKVEDLKHELNPIFIALPSKNWYIKFVPAKTKDGWKTMAVMYNTLSSKDIKTHELKVPIKNFLDLQKLVHVMTGHKIKIGDVKTSVPYDIERSQANADLFGVNNGYQIFAPTIGIDHDKTDPTRIAKDKKGDMRSHLFEDESPKDEDEPDSFEEAKRKLREQEEDEEDSSFQRIPGLTTFNSEYLINWVAAQISNSELKLSDQALTDIAVTDWVRGLKELQKKFREKFNNGTLTDEEMRMSIKADKEIEALDNTTGVGQYNIHLIEKSISKKFTNFEQDEYEDFERKISDFEKDSTEMPPKVTQAVKSFIALTRYTGTDPYNRTTQTLVDYDRVYDKLLQNLANTTDMEILEKRLRALAKYDKEIAAVAGKVFDKDKRNPIRISFFRQFMNSRRDYLQTVVSADGGTDVYNGIQNNIDKMLVDRWKLNHLTKNITTEDAKALADRIGAMKIVMQDDATNVSTEDVQEFIDIFMELGIEMPAPYVAAILGDKEVLEAHAHLEPPTAREITIIQRALLNWGNNFKEGFFDEKGNLGLFKSMAKEAAPFVDDLYSKSYKDSENKSRFAFTDPNHLLEVFNDVQQNGLAVAQKYSLENNYFKYVSTELDDRLKTLAVANVGDIRYEHFDGKTSKGKTFKNLTPSDNITSRQALFNSILKRNGNHEAVYVPFVMAEKSTSYGVKFMIDFDLVGEDNKASAKAVQTVFDTIFVTEFNRIKALESDPELALMFNYNKKGDTPFASLTEFNDNKEFVEAVKKAKDISEVSVAAKQLIGDYLNDAIIQTAKQISEVDKASQMDQGLIDSHFKGSRDNYAAVFTLNHILVANASMDLVQGDAGIVKDEIDRVKRIVGAGAAGKFATEDAIRVMYLQDDKVWVKGKDVNKPDAKGEFDSDADDAAVYVTSRYVARMKSDMGRLTPYQMKVYEKVENGEELTPEEMEVVDLISAKTVHYTPHIYNKKADVVLTREYTSYKNSKGEWVPRRGREKFHNIRVFMEEHGVDQTITQNATKGTKHDAVTQDFFKPKKGKKFNPNGKIPMVDRKGNKKTYTQKQLFRMSKGVKGEKGYVAPGYFEKTVLDGKKERLQVENNSKSKKGKFDITEPSQNFELIVSELRNVEGAKDVQLLKDTLDTLHSSIMKENVGIAERFIMKTDDNGDPDIGDFIQKAYEIMESSQESEDILKFLEEEDGDFKYSMNLSHTQKALMKILVSHFNKDVLINQMPGIKATIVPAPDILAHKNEDGTAGEAVDALEYEADPEKFEGDEYVTRPLKLHGPDGDGNTQIAEMMITKRAMDLMGLKLGDTIPPKALEIFGVRIPSQWYHSMIAARVVGFLPDTHGDIAAFPKEMPLIAGEDFDVDSRFLMIKKGYWTYNETQEETTEGDEKTTKKVVTKEYKIYGDAETAEDKWQEYYQINSARKPIKIAVKRSLKENDRYNMIKDEIKRMRQELADKNEAKSVVFEDLIHNVDPELRDLDDKLYKEFLKSVEGEGFIKDFKARYKRFKDESNTEFATKFRELIEERNDSLQKLDDGKEYTESVKEYLGELKEALDATIHDVVLNVFEDYGLETDVKKFEGNDAPVNVAAAKNQIIDTYIEMFKHKSLQDRLKVPVTLDEIIDESKDAHAQWGNVDAEGNVKEASAGIITPVGQYQAWWANVSGASNIGIVAASNIAVAYLTKNEIKLRDPLKFDGEAYGDYGKTTEDSVDEEGNVIKDANFKYDTISALITAMTDNAKERLSPKLNLLKHFVGPATFMAGLGIGKKRLVRFFLQPVLMGLEPADPIMGFSEDEILDKVGSLRSFLTSDNLTKEQKNELKAYEESLRENGLSSVDLKNDLQYNSEMSDGSTLYKNVMHELRGAKKGTASIEHLKFIARQMMVLDSFRIGLGANSTGRSLNRVLKVKQGFKEIETAEKVKEGYDNVVHKPNAFKNLATVLRNDDRIKSYLNFTKTIQNSWSKHLMSETAGYKRVKEVYGHTINPFFKDFDATYMKFLTALAFRKAYSKDGDSLYDTLYLMNNKSFPGKKNLIEQYKALLEKYPEFKNNPFIKQLDVKFKAEGRIVFPKLTVDTFTTKVDKLRDDMTYGFEELYNSDVSNIKKFAKNMILYLMHKDNFEFKAGSFISNIHPEMIKDTLDILKELQKELYLDQDKLNALGGIGSDELYTKFIDIAAHTNKKMFKGLNVVELRGFEKDLNLKKGYITLTYSENILPKQSQVTGNGKPLKYIKYDGDMYKLDEASTDEDILKFTWKKIAPVPTMGLSPYHLSLRELRRFNEDTLAVMENELPSMDERQEAINRALMEQDKMEMPIPDTKKTPVKKKPLNDNVFDDISKHKKLSDKLEHLTNREMTLGEFVEQMLPDSDYKGLIKAVERLNVKFEIVSSHQEAFGMYTKANNLIRLNSRHIQSWEADSGQTYDGESLEETIVHEVLHAFIGNLSQHKQQILRAELKDFLKSLEPYKETIDKSTPEGQEILHAIAEAEGDVEELVTYAFTNKPFTNWLATIQGENEAKKTKTTFWDKLKKIIMDRIPKSLKWDKMDELSSIMDNVLDLNKEWITPKDQRGPDSGTKMQRSHVIDTHPAGQKFSSDLRSKLLGFVKGLNIRVLENADWTIDNKTEFKDVTGAFDTLQKFLALRRDITDKDVSLHTANILYTFIGRKSIISNMLWKNIDQWEGYSEVYNKFAAMKGDEQIEEITSGEQKKNVNSFAHRQAIVHFLADALQKGVDPKMKMNEIANIDVGRDYFESRGFKNPYESNKIKKLFNAIWNFISEHIVGNKRFDDLDSQDLTDLAMDIVQDVFEKDYKKFIRVYTEKDGKVVNKDGVEFEKKEYEKTLDKDPFAKSIIERLFNNPFVDYKLSGSQVLRKFGTLFRSVDEDLHDIDGIITLDQFQSESNALKFGLWLSTDGKVLNKKDPKKFRKAIEPFLNEQSWYKNVKSMFPSWELTTAFIGKDHKKSESVTLTGTITSPDGKEYVIDFFLRTREGNYLEIFDNYWKDWKQIFEAKLQMGRAKDLNDLIYFEPFKDDINKFTNKGFRYFTFLEPEAKGGRTAQEKEQEFKAHLLADEDFGMGEAISAVVGVDTVDNLIENGEAKMVDKETREPCLRNGGSFGFTPGGKWKIVREFKGKSHEQGGIDINTKDL